jgi:hypothetical protein
MRRVHNYTEHQRVALEGLNLPDQFSFFCERKSSYSSEQVIFVYTEGTRHDSAILPVDDRSRTYLDGGAAVLVARARKRYEQMSRNPIYKESARAMSARAADVLQRWLDTHPSLDVAAWNRAQDRIAGVAR